MQKNTQSIDPVIVKTSSDKIMMLSRCDTSKFIKNQETNRLLSDFGIKTLLSKIPILEDVFLNAAPLSAIPLNAIV